MGLSELSRVGIGDPFRRDNALCSRASLLLIVQSSDGQRVRSASAEQGIVTKGGAASGGVGAQT